jgi:hypothetical protein
MLRRDLTTKFPRSKVQPHWGVLVLKRSEWKFLLLLVIAVICTSVVPRADNPETAFNEIDTPVNQTTPVAPWMKFAPPPRAPIVLLGSFGRTGGRIRTSVESTSLPTHWHLNPLRELLCTFLV